MYIIWFSGIPFSLPLGLFLSAAYLFLKQYLISVIHGDGATYVPTMPEASDVKAIAIITGCTMLWFFLWNMKRYYDGHRQFNPFAVNSVTAISDDKLKAQNKPIPSRYLSKQPDGLTIGRRGFKYVRIPFEKSPEHQLIYGSPGSKKSNIIKNALIHNFQREKAFSGGIIIDVKPELSRYTVYEGRKDIRVLNPSVKDKKRYGFDVYYGLNENSTDDDLVTRFSMVSRTIIENPGGDNSFFYQSAQNILTAFLVYGFRRGLSFGESIRQVLDASTEDLIAEILADEDMDNHPKIKRLIREYDGKDSDAFQDVTMTLRQELAIFDLDTVQYFFSSNNPRLTSPVDIVKGKFLFVAIPDHLLTTYRAIFRLICEMSINYLMSVPEWTMKGKKPCWFLIDECGSIGKIPSLIDALARGRSKGILLTMIAQSYSQLIATYGTQGAVTITDCAKINIVLSSYNPDTSRSLSLRCGNYRETKISKHSNTTTLFNSTTGMNESDEYRPIMDISDIEALERDERVLVFAKGDWFLVDKAPFYTIRQNKKLSDIALLYNQRFYKKDV